AASADFLYAGLAAVAGRALAIALAPFEFWLRLLSGLVLMGLGGYGLWNTWRTRRAIERPGRTLEALPDGWRTYAQFLGLTLLNPLTVAYFGSLILGMEAGARPTGAQP
ncbi:MAG: lysine transporter LysE, partial [Anaerolineales bacterium]